MDITKVKKLSNHTLMIGHFEDEYNSSIKKIDVKKYIFLKKNKKENIEVEGRLLKLSITSNGNVGYESQVLFGNKKFDKIKHNNSKLSLAQIWSKPMSSSEVREIVGAFAGNSKRNALDFTNLRTIQAAVKNDWESMQLFILSGEIENPDDSYFDSIFKDSENQR